MVRMAGGRVPVFQYPFPQHGPMSEVSYWGRWPLWSVPVRLFLHSYSHRCLLQLTPHPRSLTAGKSRFRKRQCKNSLFYHCVSRGEVYTDVRIMSQRLSFHMDYFNQVSLRQTLLETAIFRSLQQKKESEVQQHWVCSALIFQVDFQRKLHLFDPWQCWRPGWQGLRNPL